MEEINKRDLRKVKAGSMSIWTVISIIGASIFASGIFDGFVRPFGCRK